MTTIVMRWTPNLNFNQLHLFLESHFSQLSYSYGTADWQTYNKILCYILKWQEILLCFMLMLLFNDTHYHLHILLLLIGTRNELFTQYEGLCKRIIYLNNAKEDLTIKKEILERERARCENRSKFHSLVPPLLSF